MSYELEITNPDFRRTDYDNYDNEIFNPISNSENGEVDLSMQFVYKQTGNIPTSSYSGGRIQSGHLIALVDENGNLDIRFPQINVQGEIYDRNLQIYT